ncbi:hypothetical protein HAT86_16720, partial [Roseovarius gahaiensis]
MNTIKTILIAAGLTVVNSEGFAQSVITLDSFDLEDAGPTAAAPSTAQSAVPQSCLVNPDQPSCGSGAGGSSRQFSLSDVVNLGIIDRSEVEVENAQGTVVRVEDRVEPLPSIDLEILFDYDSADCQRRSKTRPKGGAKLGHFGVGREGR